jgi:phosphopantetheinyl transferase (holo-ACP synthase)
VKEATFKAFASVNVPYTQIYVADSESGTSTSCSKQLLGKPELRFEGRVRELATSLKVSVGHVSLSHDGDLVLATVILERASAFQKNILE